MEEVTLSVGGTRLYGRLHSPKKPRAGVILVHGFSSCLVEFGDLPANLADAGFAALAIDLRGHGASGGERGRINLARACQDIDAAADWLAKRIGRKPMACIGHSLGGSLVLGHAARNTRFAALVVAHPVHRLIDELTPWSKAAYHVIGRLGKRRSRNGRHAGTVSRPPRWHRLYVDRDAARAAEAEAFLDPVVNVASYTFATTMDGAGWAARVQAPVLAIGSAHDRTVKPAHSDAVFDALAGPVERIAHRGGHSCWRDLDGDRLTGAVVAFLRHRLEVA